MTFLDPVAIPSDEADGAPLVRSTVVYGDYAIVFFSIADNVSPDPVLATIFRIPITMSARGEVLIPVVPPPDPTRVVPLRRLSIIMPTPTIGADGMPS